MRHGGSIIDAQVPARSPRRPGPSSCYRRRRGAHRRLRPHAGKLPQTLMTASIWWRSRCGRDWVNPRVATRSCPPKPDSGRPRSHTGCSPVLYTHLPWLAHHGRWPVGEEWLLPVVVGGLLPLFRVRVDPGRREPHAPDHPGMTPVVTAQLDDPYSFTGNAYHWLANWQLRALEANERCANRKVCASSGFANTPKPVRRSRISPPGGGTVPAHAARADRRRDHRTARRPPAHPFQPLLNPRLREFALLREGLADARQRFAHTPAGIWAPECAYALRMEAGYAAVRSALLWSTVRHCTATPHWAVRSAT